MIDIKLLYTRLTQLAKKNHAGYIKPQEFNSQVHAVQMELMATKLPAIDATEQIVEDLMPFLVEVDLEVDENGLVALPDDYLHRASVSWYPVYNTSACKAEMLCFPADYMRINEVDEVCRSPIRKPSLEKKIVRHTFLGKSLRVYPFKVKKINMKYYRTPNVANIFFKYDNYVPIYVPDASNNLEWRDTLFGEFLRRMAVHTGIELKEEALLQFSQSQG